MTYRTHKPTRRSTALLFVGGGLLALAAAAGGNLLGTAACGMELPSMEQSASRALPPSSPTKDT